ncbi:PAS domain S-box protein [Baaleninema sp.]|uniref:PAS domain S-box protein n=1 Tax=Baaleninema sp. TaxID=3101197 RepID=UPI003D090B86
MTDSDKLRFLEDSCTPKARDPKGSWTLEELPIDTVTALERESFAAASTPDISIATYLSRDRQTGQRGVLALDEEGQFKTVCPWRLCRAIVGGEDLEDTPLRSVAVPVLTIQVAENIETQVLWESLQGASADWLLCLDAKGNPYGWLDRLRLLPWLSQEALESLKGRSLSELSSAEGSCSEPMAIASRASLREAADILIQNRLSAVVVADETVPDGRRVARGILTLGDLLQYATLGLDFDRTVVREAASAPLHPASLDDSLAMAVRTFTRKPLRHLVLVDRYGELAGLANSQNLFAALPASVRLCRPAALSHAESDRSQSRGYNLSHYAANIALQQNRNSSQQWGGLEGEPAENSEGERTAEPSKKPGADEAIASPLSLFSALKRVSGLAKTDTVFHDFFEAMTEIVLLFDRQGQTVGVVPTNPDLLYGEDQHILERTLERLADESNRSAILAAVGRVLDKGSSEYLEYSVPLDESGRHLWFSARLSPLGDGETVLWVARDMSDRQQSEENLHLLVDRVTEYGIFRLDPTGKIVTWNTGAERIKGYRVEEIIGQHFSCFFTEEDRAQGLPEEELHQATQTGRYETEGWRVRKDGSQLWASVSTTALYDDEGQLCGFAKVTRDVTERLAAEIWLRLLERAISESSNGIAIADATGKDNPLIYVNRGFERITGYRQQEVIGRNSRFLQGSDRQQSALKEVRQALKEERPCCVTLRNYRKDGSLFWNELTVSPIRDGNGRVTHYIGVQTDVTERKETERRLAELSAQLQAILDAATDVAIIATDLDGTIAVFNAGAERMLGYRAEEVVGQHTLLLFHLDRELEIRRQELNRREGSDTSVRGFDILTVDARQMEKGETTPSASSKQEWTYVRQDGSLLTVDLTVTMIRDEKGQPTGYLGIAQDITERKRTRERLRQQLVAVEAALDGMAVLDANNNFIYVNDAYAKLLGYDSADAVGNRSWRESFPPEEFDRLERQIYPQVMRKGQWRGEVIAQRWDGRSFIAELSLKLTDRGELVCICRDITQPRRSEIQLRESEARFRQFAENIESVFWMTDPDKSRMLYVSPAYERIWGRSCADLYRNPRQWIDAIHPEDRDRVLGALPKQVRDEYCEEYRIGREDGSIRWVRDRAFAVKDDFNRVYRIVGIAEDITERKEAEAALQQQTELLQKIFDSLPVMIATYDARGQVTLVNRYLEETLGWSAQEILAIDLLEQCYPDFEYRQQVVSVMLHQDGQWHDFQTRTRDGRILETSWANIQLSDGNSIGIGRDITEQKRAEVEIARAKERFELVVRASNDGFWDWDLETGEIYYSPRWKEMLGYADEELENDFSIWEQSIFEDDRVTMLELLDDYNAGRRDRFHVVQRFHHRDGSTVYVLCRAIHLKNSEGQVVRMVGSNSDITELVRVQQALKDSELQLAGILNSSLDGIMAFRSLRDEEGAIFDFEWRSCNPAAARLVGRSGEDLLGCRLLEELPGNRDEGLFDAYVRVVETGKPSEREFFYDRDGIRCWFQSVAVKLGDGFAVTFRNITKIKQGERDLQRANAELEVRVAELKQRNTEMELLSNMNDFLQSCLTVEEAYKTVATLIRPLFPHCSGAVYTLHPSKNWVEEVASWGKPHTEVLFSPQDCWAIRRGRVHWVEGAESELFCPHVHQVNDSPAVTLCVPTTAQGETLGLLTVAAEDPAHLSRSKRQLARTVAEQLALAVANLRLRETLQNQSIRDGLTGLFNRRYMEESLEQYVHRAGRYGQTLGVVMLDVDRFKQFNDTFGHNAGDLVLQAVGQLLRDNVRGSDIACRYGGEELTLILPDATLEDTVKRAEEIRESIERLELWDRGQRLGQITASLGVASFPQHGLSGGAVVQGADAALYRAKARGRNCVVVAETSEREG